MVDRATIIKVFKKSPVPTLILKADAPNFTILEVNDAYQEVMCSTEKELIGEIFFEAFPPNTFDIDGDGKSGVEASFHKVIEFKTSDRIHHNRHDGASSQVTYEQKHWDVENTPVLNDKNEVEFIIHTIHNTPVNGVAGNSGEITEQVEANKNAEIDLKKTHAELYERVKEQRCLYNLSSLQEQGLTIQELLHKAVKIIPEGFRLNEQAEARITWKEEIFQTEHFTPSSPYKLSESNNRFGAKSLQIEVIYTNDNISFNKNPFLPEEHQLLKAIGNQLSQKIDHIIKLDELQKTELKYRNVVEHSTNLFYQHDVNGVLTYVSTQSYDFFGYSPEESKRQWIDFITDHPKNKKGEELTQKAIKTGKTQQPYELELKKKDGEIVWVKVNEAPMLEGGKVVGMVGSLTDITEQKLYEHQLKESLERYDYASKATRDAIYDWNIAIDHLHWGEGFKNLFGHQSQNGEFSIDKWVKHVHPDDVEETEIDLNLTLKDSSKNNWEYEYRFRNANGEYAHVIESGHIIRDENGHAIRMIGAMRDISETKQNEIKNKLQQEVARFFKENNELNSILGQVLKYLADYGKFKAAEIWLSSTDQAHQYLVSNFAKDKKTELFFKKSNEVKKFNKGQGLPGTVWEYGKTIVWDDIDANDLFLRKKAASKAGLKSAFGLPLYHNQNFVGVLLCSSDANSKLYTNTIQLYEVLQEFLGAEIKRKQQEEELLLLFESAPEIIAIASPLGRFAKVNPAFCKILGYTKEEITSRPFESFLHPEDANATEKEYEETISGERQANNFVNRYRTKSGEYRWISWNSSNVFGEDGSVFAFGRDVTETKELEELLNHTNRLAKVGSWEMEIREGEDDKIYWSEMTREMLEVDDSYNPSLSSGFEFYKPESRKRIEDAVKKALTEGKSFDMELKVTTAKNNEKWVRCIGETDFDDHKCVRMYGSFQDITHRKQAEVELEEAFKEKETILESIGDGFFTLDHHWTVTYWNREAERLMQTHRKEVIEKNLWDVFPETVELITYTNLHRAMHEQKDINFEDFFPDLNKWFDISAYPSAEGISIFFKDISERKRARQQLVKLNTILEKRASELSASNAELEQFAYVASHDLQEPLRMVSSFLTQLEKKYSDQLDEKAREYIHFAVDGAQRMRQIILDLLNYSRLNKGKDKRETVNLNKVLEEIKSLERSHIEETKAKIKVHDLPSVRANPGPIQQVFQNLISNALKYHVPGKHPEIEIEAAEQKSNWKFSVKDNGIGINPEFKDTIFQIFQRLHTRDQYSGTGIGLAISKKIIERHNGEIWVESEEGKGSTFYFTIEK